MRYYGIDTAGSFVFLGSFDSFDCAFEAVQSAGLDIIAIINQTQLDNAVLWGTPEQIDNGIKNIQEVTNE